MLKVALNGIRIFANHGYYDEEAILGNEFEIDIEVTTSMKQEDSDELADTLNYENLFSVVSTEMAERSKLLEHVLYRIKSSLISLYPHDISGLYISIQKLNPPLGGSIRSSRITLEENYESKCAKCGSSFNCFKSIDCWCNAEMNLSDVTREQIQRQYTGCLCSVCLRSYQYPPELLVQN